MSTNPDAGESPHGALATLALFLNESVMGFLALVALATALGPMVFDVSPAAERALTVVEWVLVATFALEFAVQGAVAEDRRAWLRSPWRLVDAVTILGPVAALLPQVSDLASGSLALRLLRVGRAVAFGTRAGSVAVRRRRAAGPAPHAATPRVTSVAAEGDLHPAPSDWAGFLAWSRDPGPAWFHASDLDTDRFHELARAAGLPDPDLERILRGDGHARLRDGDRHALLHLTLPTADAASPELRRERVLAVVTDRGVLTATTGSLDLPAAVASLSLPTPLPATIPFPARIAVSLLALARAGTQAAFQSFDDEYHRLESVSIREGGRAFLEEAFLLRRRIATAALDLWHVKGVVRSLADGKTKLRGVNLKDERALDDLAAETESLFQSIHELKDDLQGLLELHMNVKSFEQNNFLKLLAIVSFLGLIPSVLGGLLGMNVAGNPWPVTLGQVAFGVAMGMATALYVFAIKGWLR